MLGLSQVFGREIVVGIDIGSRCIKVVQVESTGAGRFRVIRAGMAETPVDSVRDGVVIGKDSVAQAIKDILQRCNIEATSAVAAISGSSVIVRHVKLPKIPEVTLRKSIKFEASRYISSPLDGSLVEFEITGMVPGEEDKMAVMLVAAPNEMVDSRLAAISAAGLEPISMDIEAFAVQRFLLDLSPERDIFDDTVVLLNIGACATDVNIIAGGQFALTRNIPIGGNNFSQALRAVSPSQELADVEALKQTVDMSVLLQPGAEAVEVSRAQTIQPVLDELLREVRRSMNYYQSQLADPSNANLPAHFGQHNNSPVSRIIVTGGSARLHGLEEYMAARLGTEVEVGIVANGPALEIAPQCSDEVHSAPEQYVLAAGLAMKEMLHSVKRAPQKPKEEIVMAQAA